MLKHRGASFKKGSNGRLLLLADCQKVFNGIKQAITADMALALYDPNAPTHLSTDTSGVGISAILSQEQGAGRLS